MHQFFATLLNYGTHQLPDSVYRGLSAQQYSKQTGGVTTMGEEQKQVLIQINEKQWKFTALTLRLKLLLEKTKFLNSAILIHGNEKKKVLYNRAPFIFFIYYFIAMPL